MRAVSQGQTVTIRKPLAIRPWQHVLEPLSGYLLLAEKLCIQGASFAEGWNFGPNEDDAKPVQWIVGKLVNTRGDDASWVMFGGNHPHEAIHLKLDCSKARTRLDWHRRWTLNKALEKIIDWHKAINNVENMHTKTLEQISQYDPRAQL